MLTLDSEKQKEVLRIWQRQELMGGRQQILGHPINWVNPTCTAYQLEWEICISARVLVCVCERKGGGYGTNLSTCGIVVSAWPEIHCGIRLRTARNLEAGLTGPNKYQIASARPSFFLGLGGLRLGHPDPYTSTFMGFTMAVRLAHKVLCFFYSLFWWKIHFSIFF